MYDYVPENNFHQSIRRSNAGVTDATDMLWYISFKEVISAYCERNVCFVLLIMKVFAQIISHYFKIKSNLNSQLLVGTVFQSKVACTNLSFAKTIKQYNE